MRGRKQFLEVGGMDDSYFAPPNTAALAQDLAWDSRGGWKRCGGYGVISSSLSVETVTSMTYFSRRSGAENYIVLERVSGSSKGDESDVKISYIDFTELIVRDIDTTAQDSIAGLKQQTSFAQNGGWLYWLNGRREPKRWNGRECMRAGFEKGPGAPVLGSSSTGFNEYDRAAADWTATNGFSTYQRGVGEQGGTSTEQPFLYGYAYTWVNDLGQESPLSPVAWVREDNPQKGGGAPLGAGKHSILINLSAGPTGTRGVKLYRTINSYGLSAVNSANGAGVRLYFHSLIAGNIDWTLVDDYSDSELGTEFDRDSVGAWPSSAKLLAFFKGHAWLAGISGKGDRIYYSAPLFPEQFPEVNYLILGSQRSGEVTAFYPASNALIVFKQRGIYLVKSEFSSQEVTGFTAQTLTEDLGAICPQIVEVPGRGALFLAEDGVYLLEGALQEGAKITGIQKISQPINRTWRKRVSPALISQAKIVINHRDQEVWIQVAEGSKRRLSLGLIYHYVPGFWSLREGFSIAAFCESQGDNQYLFIGGDAGKPGLFLYSHAFTNKDATAFSGYYLSNVLNFSRKETILAANVLALDIGRALNVNYKEGRKDFYGLSSISPETALNTRQDASLSQKDSEKNRIVWGGVNWDTNKYWTEEQPVLFPYSPYTKTGELQILINGGRFLLFGFEIEIPEGGTDISPGRPSQFENAPATR